MVVPEQSKTRSKRAKPARLEGAILRFGRCRSLGHEWKHEGRITDEDEDGTRLLSRPQVFGMIGFRSICMNCGTERLRWVTRSGMLDKAPEYRYPDGYQTHGDDVRPLQSWRESFIFTTMDGIKERKAS